MKDAPQFFRAFRIPAFYSYAIGVARSISRVGDLLSLLLKAESEKAIGLDSADLRTANPLAACPRQYWSQADEDGILEQILRRIEPPKTFLEVGVGDGLENNTAYLLSLGWSGGWIGDEELGFRIAEGGRLRFLRQRVDLTNLTQAVDGVIEPSQQPLGVISIDVDGNDWHFVQALLQAGIKSTIWIIEYNGRFPVGCNWVMPYDEAHVWDGSDYFGASLSAISELMKKFGYELIACSSQGANAFFISIEHSDAFGDCPRDEADIYMPPLYRYPKFIGHRPDPRTLEAITAGLQAPTVRGGAA